MKSFKNKKVLIAGGTGLVGTQLVNLLIEQKARVYVVSNDTKSINKKIIKKYKLDLSYPKSCDLVTKNMDLVINAIGYTGSIETNIKYPNTFFSNNLLPSINLLNSCSKNKVKEFLYTSSYGIYSPKLKMKEENAWRANPSDQDKYAGWAKRICELHTEAVGKEKNIKKIYIVRPGNIFGPNCKYNAKNTMVIAALIKKFLNNKMVKVWGDGSQVRDFIYSKDVAQMILQVIKKEIPVPINLGHGKGITIKKVVDLISKNKNIPKRKVLYTKKYSSTDKKRILSTSLLKKFNIKTQYTFKEALDETIEWCIKENNKLVNH